MYQLIKLFVFSSAFLCLTTLISSSTSYAQGSNINFTEEELQWLKEHPSIRVANEMDWNPFDYFEYGKPKGLSIDHIALVAKRAGLKIEYINGYSWTELLEQFQFKEIDVMPAYYYNEARSEFSLWTKAYYRAKLAIMTRKDSTITTDSLYNVRVGMQKDNGSINVVEKQYPNLKITEEAFNVDLVRQLATKKIDVVIGNPLVLYYHAKEEQIKNIKLQAHINMTIEEQAATSLHIGVRKDWPILLSILQKSMDSINVEEFSEIEKRWTSVIVTKGTDWTFIIKIFAGVFVIILFLYWNNKKLQRMVVDKTDDLNGLNNKLTTLNSSLESKVLKRTAELVESNKVLEKMANTDPMTGAYNRRRFFQLASDEFSFSTKHKTPISVAMLDIDHFKLINDTHGHDAGDKVIKNMVDIMHSLVRSNDVVSRFGGEEFAILFPDTDLAHACALAEAICSFIATQSEKNNIHFTVSAGVAEFCSENNAIDKMLMHADKSLYHAKRNGRNRVSSIPVSPLVL